MGEGVDDALVVICALCLVPGNGECRRSKLQGSVVGDVETPVVMKSGGSAGGEVAISHREKIGDLFGA